jgi:hypothetical protein
MPAFEEITRSLDSTVRGTKDASGQTPLDRAIDLAKLENESARNDLASYLIQLFPRLAEKGAAFLKLGRHVVRRYQLKDRRLAESLRILLSGSLAKRNVEIRLWIMLTLMDLGFPPTVASLTNDDELRATHIGEWLTLISANESYFDVKDAFVKAASDNLINERQLLLKIDAIRRQFGHRLFDFLSSVVPAVPSDKNRKSLVVSLKKMYGMNIEPSKRRNPKKESDTAIGHPLSSFSAKTARLLKNIGAEADRRAEDRQVA